MVDRSFQRKRLKVEFFNWNLTKFKSFIMFMNEKNRELESEHFLGIENVALG